MKFKMVLSMIFCLSALHGTAWANNFSNTCSSKGWMLATYSYGPQACEAPYNLWYQTRNPNNGVGGFRPTNYMILNNQQQPCVSSDFQGSNTPYSQPAGWLIPDPWSSCTGSYQARKPLNTTPPVAAKHVSDEELLNLAQSLAKPRPASKSAKTLSVGPTGGIETPATGSDVGTLDNQGEIDGIYSCNITVSTKSNGTATTANYTAVEASVSGHADGTEVIMIPGFGPTGIVKYYGYGAGMIGDIDDHTFHGATNSYGYTDPASGNGFSFTIGYSASASAPAGTYDQMTLNGNFYISATETAAMACTTTN